MVEEGGDGKEEGQFGGSSEEDGAEARLGGTTRGLCVGAAGSEGTESRKGRLWGALRPAVGAVSKAAFS